MSGCTTDPESLKAYPCPWCGKPAAVALGVRHRQMCRCDGCVMFWMADTPAMSFPMSVDAVVSMGPAVALVVPQAILADFNALLHTELAKAAK